jgi:hypothetical protein
VEEGVEVVDILLDQVIEVVEVVVREEWRVMIFQLIL